MAQQQPAQGDAALDAFDKLCFREVAARHDDTAATLLAKFQSTAASLGPEERIKLGIYMHAGGVEFLEAVLSDPQANKICALQWWYGGKEDVSSVFSLLASNCPELALLQVYFVYHSAFDFVSNVLEHPSNRLKVVHMPEYAEGDLTRFFAALGQSQVSALTVTGDGSLKFVRGLCEYLARDLLVRLEVRMNHKQVPPEWTTVLAECTCLDKLEMWQCKFLQPTVFAFLPKSTTKLKLERCTFVGGFDWSFLVGSGVRELDLTSLDNVDGTQLGNALAVHVRAKGLHKLRLGAGDFINETLAAMGVELGLIKRLEILSHLNHASIRLISLVLRSLNSELRGLALPYDDDTVGGIENHLLPALRHPNCSLNKLSLYTSQEGLIWFGKEVEYKELKAAAKQTQDTFRSRCGLFALLQGQQVRRKSPLRRLPVEMFRMVAMMLM